jgi:hypothetical protein
MKYTYTICFIILFCGMNCNNGVEKPTMYSQVVDFEKFDTEKRETQSRLFELELLNLKLERHLHKIQPLKAGVVHPITNTIDY